MEIKPEDLRVNGWGSKRQSPWIAYTPKGVQLIHLPTGIVIEEDSERTQHGNKRVALERLKVELEEI